MAVSATSSFPAEPDEDATFEVRLLTITMYFMKLHSETGFVFSSILMASSFLMSADFFSIALILLL